MAWPIRRWICNTYTMVTRDLSRKTTRSPRAQPEGEVWFSVINPWLPWYNYNLFYALHVIINVLLKIDNVVEDVQSLLPTRTSIV